MYLKKAIYVNWGNIPQLEFEFGPINLFSGGNGSGKTTAADGLQTLLTAAHENLFNYNPGQDETTQRGRGGKQVRTLASYVLGCDDGSYARTGLTDGYLAAVFYPTTGESSEPFTVVMGMRAHLDNAGNQRQARLDEQLFMLVPGHSLCLSHFVRDYIDGKHVTPLTSLPNLLSAEFGAQAIEIYDKKGAYLRRLYGLLRGKRDSVSDREAKHAAHTFANFMAYKPVKNINQFVADEILEKKDLGDAIRTVSDLMKTIHGMEQDARFIRESLAILQEARDKADAYQQGWLQKTLYEYQEALRQSRLQQQTYIAGKQQQSQQKAAIEEKNQRLVVNAERSKATLDAIIEIRARRQGIGALKQKDALEQELRQQQQKLVELAPRLLAEDRQLQANIEASQQLLQQLGRFSFGQELPALEDKVLRNLAREVAQQGERQRVDLPALLGQDWVDLSPLEQHLETALTVQQVQSRWLALWLESDPGHPNLRDGLAALCNEWQGRLAQKQKALMTREKEINILAAERVSYPAHVELALAAIRERCPKADPRVLCDYVEVLDPQWQMAIEGYLGGARYSIIVSEDCEAEAIRIVRSLPGQRNQARVIQGSKARADASRLTLGADSIVKQMKFGHKTAEYYLCASYGNVRQVEDTEALRHTARGLTREGLASGNYSLWRCDLPDAELVFGQGARLRALAAKQREYHELLQLAQQQQEQVQAADSLFAIIDRLRPIAYASTIQDMVTCQRLIKACERSLDQLDISDFTALEQELVQYESEHKVLQSELRQLENEKGQLQEALSITTRQLQAVADQQERLLSLVDEHEQQVRGILQVQPEFDVERALQQADDTLRVEQHSHYQDEISRLLESLNRNAAAINQVILQHNQHCHVSDAIVYSPDFGHLHQREFFNRIGQLRQQVDNIHNRLQNNVLVEKYDQLQSLRARFNDTFVSHLCHSIFQAINDGERILKDLNRELEHHRFGTDQERFYFSWQWVPEFRDYYRFFKEVSNLPNLGEGASLFELSLPRAVAEVRDKLVSMLLDEDEQKAFRELQRIADYRNYRSYDIFKEPLGKAPIPLSQYGTGSGGQLETPAYIIRSAAVASAFRFNEGSSHLRMVLVDEAFSKMDEARSREVISYLTGTLGLQLVFIMPTSKSGPFMDLISNQFVFSKCPVSKPVGELNTRVLVDRKQCNQDKIRALWAQHRAAIRDQVLLDFMEDIP